MKLSRTMLAAASLAAAATLAMTPVAAAAGSTVTIDGREHPELKGCQNIGDLTDSQSESVRMANDMGWPLYVHSGRDCQNDSWTAMSGTAHTVSTHDSIYVPPRPA
ncbi:hypothetical protein ACFUCH_12070 [Streptomyces olivaceus]|uniref:hypothetical protein n=1 Tax=Streptomyces olivaceus TaxID=47716 RepID=UPI003635A4EB